MGDKIRISYEELKSSKVDEVISRQTQESALRRGMGTAGREQGKVSLLHKSWLNLMLAGMAGAFIAWVFLEPYFDDFTDKTSVATALLLPTVGGFIGLLIGAMEGFLSRNYGRAALGGSVGLGIGFGGGCLTSFIANIVIFVAIILGTLLVGEEAATHPDKYLSGFIIYIIARAMAWTVAGLTVGLGPGIALRSKKLVVNGLIGGMLGGFIGGFLFDPINFAVGGGTFNEGAELSRAIGFMVIGAFAGLMMGLVEMFSKDAWLVMTGGPLTGKQFVLYKDQTFLGSSPKCEVYLFKDPDIDPFHGVINKNRDGYYLEDKESKNGILVNHQPVRRKKLEKGDEIQIGGATFIYSERDKKK